MTRAIITVGLGFGDEGKGGWCDHLCRKYGASLVVRYNGGSQCGHNVVLADGHRHTFSQFGAGTFAGVRTLLAPGVIVNLPALVREAEALAKYESAHRISPQNIGGKDGHILDMTLGRYQFPYNMLMVSSRCLVSTIYHRGANQLKELLRGKNRHGSCGHGIGETRSYWLRYGADAITMRDVHSHKFSDNDRGVCLEDKLVLMKARLVDELSQLAYDNDIRLDDFMGCQPWEEATNLREIGRKLSCMYDSSGITEDSDTIVFEGAQGVLLDEWNGFHPHTTWSTTTPEQALEIAMENGITDLCVLGLTRTYSTRHGNGPLPTYDNDLTSKLVDTGNPYNAWQGNMRCGWLDLPLLRYAAKACKRLDGILVSHCDQVNVVNKVCIGHDELPDPPSFPNLRRQEEMGKALEDAIPDLSPIDLDGLFSQLSAIAPVVGKSFGPREAAKLSSVENLFKGRK